jgi:NADPH:quinone reductase-like Zn-dependent oxidoreductase
VRAVSFREFGDPSVLTVEDRPDPSSPTRDQILVRVEASSVNGTDLGLRRGAAKVVTLGRMPFVPGFDLAGEVMACGPAVTAFSPGDRVVALLGHSGGGQAQQVVLPQGRAALAPQTVDPNEAATLPLAGLTALQALYGVGRIRAQRAPRVLVIGAAGGIGSFGVQLAKLAGAHVTGAASGPKLQFVRSLGADEVVDYREQDVAELGERWDLILDASGHRRFVELRPVLAQEGVLVSSRVIGADALRTIVPATVRGKGPRFAVVMTQARSQDLAHLATLVDRGVLRPPLDRVYPLDDVVQAHQHAEGTVQGKVVLQLA